MSVKTDLLAVTILDADEAGGQSATPGYSVRAAQQALLQLVNDCIRQVTVQTALMPAGTAKTAMATVLADLL